jgi:general secretion pathway protein L
VIDVRADEQAPLMLDASIEIEWTPSNDPAISVLATNLDEANAIDLLQGEYSKREQLSKLWRPWRAAAALLLVWVVAQLAAMGFEYRQLQSLSIAQRKQAEEIYTQTFPESRKGQDLSVIRAEMKRKTEALRGGGADGQGAFLTMLSDVGEPISKAPSVALERLSYRVGEINVSFSIADVQQLDELKQKLAATGGLVIEIQSAAQRDGKVDARLNIAKAGT